MKAWLNIWAVSLNKKNIARKKKCDNCMVGFGENVQVKISHLIDCYPGLFSTKRKSELHFFEIQVKVLLWLD